MIENAGSDNESFEPSPGAGGVLPKPVIVEKKENAFFRSMISLLVYALLFYFLFDRDIAYIAAVLLVIIIHEMGHFTFMKMFNYSNVKIFIVPLLGAFTAGRKQQVSQWQLSLIILAGPVPGIIIGMLLYWFNRNIHHETLTMLANCFLFINVLNCLPFYPLDGGRLVETLFFKENHVIRLVFGIISIIALAFMFIATFNPLLLVIPVLIGFELFNEQRHEKIREYLRQERINYYTDYQGLPDKDYWLIRDCLIMSFPKKYAMVTPGKQEYSIMESLFVQHIGSVLKVNLKPDLNLLKRMLVLLFYIGIFVAPIVLYVTLNFAKK